MAAGAILAALANIPWGQVVDNAPKLAEGAARLMRAVSGLRKPKPAADEASGAGPATPTELKALQLEVTELRHTVVDLQEQLQVSSQLLKDLTDQNIQLIQRVELNRVRLWWAGLLSGGALLAALGVITFLLAGLDSRP